LCTVLPIVFSAAEIQTIDLRKSFRIRMLNGILWERKQMINEKIARTRSCG
jgi:hypothetical protein